MRYGYRRVHVHLRREGWDVNHKKVHRIYDELGLQLRNKRPKRRVKARLRDHRCAAVAANETWAMDFVHDQLATGRRLRVLTIVDTWSLFSPAVDPRFSYRAGTSSRRSTGSAPKWDSPRRSASTRAASPSPATSTSGPTCTA